MTSCYFALRVLEVILFSGWTEMVCGSLLALGYISLMFLQTVISCWKLFHAHYEFLQIKIIASCNLLFTLVSTTITAVTWLG